MTSPTAGRLLHLDARDVRGGAALLLELVQSGKPRKRIGGVSMTLEDLKRHLTALVSTEKAASNLHVSRRRVQQLAKERKLGLQDVTPHPQGGAVSSPPPEAGQAEEGGAGFWAITLLQQFLARTVRSIKPFR